MEVERREESTAVYNSTAVQQSTAVYTSSDVQAQAKQEVPENVHIYNVIIL